MRDTRAMSMPKEPNDGHRWRAEAIAAVVPRDILAQLLALDGTSRANPVDAPRGFNSFHPAVGLCEGTPSGMLIGPPSVWLTPLGQRVVDLLKANPD